MKSRFAGAQCVLIVDDEVEDLQKMVGYLDDLHLRVLTATNADDALKLIRAEPVAILITDIIMPMYRLTKEEYYEFVGPSGTGAHSSGVTRRDRRIRVIEEETKRFSEFAGFKLLDKALAVRPSLRVIVVSRYADLEMARFAIGKKVHDILSKDKHLCDGKLLTESVQAQQRQITLRNRDEFVFVSYVSKDSEVIERLIRELTYHGIKVWTARTDIDPGRRWKDAIRSAINQGAFFVACFSKKFDHRRKTYMYEELQIAIGELRLRSPNVAWFIPVKLDECEIPDLPTRVGETLRDLQWIDLASDWSGGISQLLGLMRKRQ